jgi:NADH-quinone oxidoreductase subunit H
VIANINVGILYIFAISSLEVYGVIMGGWASNSKYPFLGALRSAAQMVSYEVSIGFVIVDRAALRRLAQPDRVVLSQKDGLGTHLGLPASHSSTGTGWPVPDVRHLLHLGARRDEPAALRPGRGGIRARGRHMVEYGSTPYLLFMLSNMSRSC